MDRRRFTKAMGAGTAAVGLAWQQACAQVAESGTVSDETLRTLLDSQGPRSIYADPDEFEKLRAAVTNSVRIQEELRAFELSDDEQPLTVFRRG